MIGGIEASLRRAAQFDYWQEKVRRSVLLDSKADILLYGNAERALVELTHGLAQGKTIEDMRHLRGTAVAARAYRPVGIKSTLPRSICQGRSLRSQTLTRTRPRRRTANLMTSQRLN